MKFPRYTREENLKCKLTDEQIKQIRARRKQGDSYQTIANDYGVSAPAIHYWCISDQARKEIIQKRYRKHGTKRNHKDYFKQYRERKKELYPELSDYELETTLTYRKNNPEKAKESQKKSDAKYYSTHKKQRLEYSKKYQQANLDKFREYNKKCREKKYKIIN